MDDAVVRQAMQMAGGYFSGANANNMSANKVRDFLATNPAFAQRVMESMQPNANMDGNPRVYETAQNNSIIRQMIDKSMGVDAPQTQNAPMPPRRKYNEVSKTTPRKAGEEEMGPPDRNGEDMDPPFARAAKNAPNASKIDPRANNAEQDDQSTNKMLGSAAAAATVGYVTYRLINGRQTPIVVDDKGKMLGYATPRDMKELPRIEDQRTRVPAAANNAQPDLASLKELNQSDIIDVEGRPVVDNQVEGPPNNKRLRGPTVEEDVKAGRRTSVDDPTPPKKQIEPTNENQRSIENQVKSGKRADPDSPNKDNVPKKKSNIDDSYDKIVKDVLSKRVKKIK